MGWWKVRGKMIEEAKRVVAGLRYCYRHIHCYSIKDGERCPDYDSCQKKVADNVSRNDALADLIESLYAQLGQVEMERDALLDELKGECDVCANWKGCTAPKCRKSSHKECEECLCRTCIYDTNWKWEGVEVEG